MRLQQRRGRQKSFHQATRGNFRLQPASATKTINQARRPRGPTKNGNSSSGKSEKEKKTSRGPGAGKTEPSRAKRNEVFEMSTENQLHRGKQRLSHPKRAPTKWETGKKVRSPTKERRAIHTPGGKKQNGRGQGPKRSNQANTSPVSCTSNPRRSPNQSGQPHPRGQHISGPRRHRRNGQVATLKKKTKDEKVERG